MLLVTLANEGKGTDRAGGHRLLLVLGGQSRRTHERSGQIRRFCPLPDHHPSVSGRGQSCLCRAGVLQS
jgi:hypothetical protein